MLDMIMLDSRYFYWNQDKVRKSFSDKLWHVLWTGSTNNTDLTYTKIRLCFSLCVSECPLTMAAQLEGCAELIKILKNGGAHLDFRTRDGITALHKAVRTKNHTALIVSNKHARSLSLMGGNIGFSYILERNIRGVCDVSCPSVCVFVCSDMSHRVA